MSRVHDHYLPLAPEHDMQARIDDQGRLRTASAELGTLGWTWMLEIQYTAPGLWRLPGITVAEHDRPRFTQYLETRQSGKRLLNLNGIDDLTAVTLSPQGCRLSSQARLLGFPRPPLDDGPLVIIAPHPDDAELAAYGLYRQHAERAWILTLTAGEYQKRLDRQYLPFLDPDLKSASRRKGWIRAWNSATTPMLAGLSLERLYMLGYFNDTLGALLETPTIPQPSLGDETLSPADFRGWNPGPLASDERANGPENRGSDLLADLERLLDEIRPSTVVTPHPELDPHPDHRASSQALALAMRGAGHRPQRVLLYANHLRSQRGFPRGPAHAAAGIWPVQYAQSRLGPWSLYSQPLDLETQREKAVAMDSMHDLRDKPGWERRLKRATKRRLSGLSPRDWPCYGQHDYFQTHIKAHEVFVQTNAEAFLASFDGE
ncbi:PIG-L deacetylase family protein [Halomonas caseinilytica]|uniref:PIG-L deacetylase family protein n=1 Tax=Halomonas caseinilytica TaxID=438744 RepID=UPI000848C4D6|nr:PIG-L family deacetylase [Halomonas caseinilytica]